MVITFRCRETSGSTSFAFVLNATISIDVARQNRSGRRNHCFNPGSRNQVCQIRDKVVQVFDTVMCDNPNVEQALGVSLVDIGTTAKKDLTELSNFIDEYLQALLSGIKITNGLANGAGDVFSKANFAGWPVVIVAGALFLLPAFFIIGVGFAMMNIRVRLFQLVLSYFLLPIFTAVIMLCIILCCVLLPLSAANSGEIYLYDQLLFLTLHVFIF